ncbi:NUDIX hydrolase [Thermoproteota archaeon]
MQALKDDKRRDIFKQFLYNNSMKFSEIERATKIRSNELAYFLQKMIDDSILMKDNGNYILTKQAEKHIPFFVEDNKQSPLPVVLVACRNHEGKILLIHRKKRPYNNQWSLPGGRIKLHETIEDATIRNIKEKTFLDVKFVSVNAIVHEHYKADEEMKSAFMLFFVLTEPLNQIKEQPHLRWFSLDEIKELKMIPSDQWLVLNKLESRTDVIHETINEDSQLSMQMKSE